jgi:hypothetical protein
LPCPARYVMVTGFGSFLPMQRLLLKIAAGAFLLGLAGCNPYDPGQRAVGGGLIGAGAGAAIGAAAGGNAGTGALIGGGLGAIGGAATTPSRGY